MNDGGNYYRRRVEEELAAAERADDPGIAQIHRDLAERYKALIAGSAVSDRQLPQARANGSTSAVPTQA